jgi:hypothetical protein
MCIFLPTVLFVGLAKTTQPTLAPSATS